jgi:hypothetical protein
VRGGPIGHAPVGVFRMSQPHGSARQCLIAACSSSVMPPGFSRPGAVLAPSFGHSERHGAPCARRSDCALVVPTGWTWAHLVDFRSASIPLFSPLIQCPGTESNHRHEDFQSTTTAHVERGGHVSTGDLADEPAPSDTSDAFRHPEIGEVVSGANPRTTLARALAAAYVEAVEGGDLALAELTVRSMAELVAGASSNVVPLKRSRERL